MALTFSGRTIASTNFIDRSSFGHDQDCAFAVAVRLLAMLTDIEANALVVGAGAHTNDQCHHLQNDERCRRAEGDRGKDGDQLNPELLRVSEERPVDDTVP